MGTWIPGPALSLLRQVGLSASEVYIATAFYSASPLAWLGREIAARKVTIGVRLDFHDQADWIRGYIDPPALTSFVRGLQDRGVIVNLYTSPEAHAKVFVGNRGAIIGSANLTTRGFGAGAEMVCLVGADQVSLARSAVKRYLRNLRKTSLTEIETFVLKHWDAVRRARKAAHGERRPAGEDRLPKARFGGRHLMAGDYDDFLRWLRRQRVRAAHVILARARGEGNLQGHIRRNFSGLRQFLIASPGRQFALRGEDPDAFRLFSDSELTRDMLHFVRDNAADETDFVLDIWRTYLPIECGGRARKRGGTIGNLNRMLPLMARYLSSRGSV